jgi:hypothetical protein
MKKIILFLIVCSPLTLMAEDQIPTEDSAPQDYMFAYERPGVREPASPQNSAPVKKALKAKDQSLPKKKTDPKVQ